MRILVTLEGVLQRGNNPIVEGARLLQGLKPFNELIILTADSAESANRWLAENRYSPLVDELIDNKQGLHGEDLTRRQITLQRTQKPVDALVTADPSLAAWAFDQGIVVYLFAHPGVSRPEWRPDAPKKVRAWTDIEESIKNRVLHEVGYDLDNRWE
jgi:hypothetical protein